MVCTFFGLIFTWDFYFCIWISAAELCHFQYLFLRAAIALNFHH